MFPYTHDNTAKKKQKIQHEAKNILADNDYYKSRKAQALGHSPILRDHRHHRKTKQVSEGNERVAILKEPNYFLAQGSSKQNGGGSKDC